MYLGRVPWCSVPRAIGELLSQPMQWERLLQPGVLQGGWAMSFCVDEYVLCGNFFVGYCKVCKPVVHGFVYCFLYLMESNPSKLLVYYANMQCYPTYYGTDCSLRKAGHTFEPCEWSSVMHYGWTAWYCLPVSPCGCANMRLLDPPDYICFLLVYQRVIFCLKCIYSHKSWSFPIQSCVRNTVGCP